ncbi:MAG: glycoside hydrolase family 3 N-terminal domain-containing protein [Lachnospiraceae bacterium]|nr:glycoside hydrolase family 3 protein [Robinsoniella sp.]MDY3765254.1 glycoside hydrolase family 3 N-terminal domain-containing protein [Lachnospiraceae bacterium]
MKRSEKRRMRKAASLLLTATMAASSLSAVAFAGEANAKYEVIETEYGYNKVVQDGGKTLTYSPESGVTLLEDDGFAFKDLNQNGQLDTYEDWRLDTATRAQALADMMVADGREGIESIAGLMLYSAHTAVGSEEVSGTELTATSTDATTTMDAITTNNIRHILVTTLASPEIAAKWNNNLQAIVEGMDYGIPCNNSSDPRHEASSAQATEYVVGASGDLSQWPSSLGMAATFDPALVQQFGEIASAEYRALGISTALSPQIDLATEPRWSRVNGTFGENSDLATDMARAYVDGFQSTYDENGEDLGWGEDSVNAMVKHWPSGGPEEGGRDGHYGYGKYAVYPGDNFDTHKSVFTEGAFKLNGKTGSATAVMPYYTISYEQAEDGTNYGNGFSNYMINELLRGEYEYDGVCCTDWMITADAMRDSTFTGKCWGVEDITIAERHYQALMAGMDQFGGNNLIEPVMAAYDMMVEKNGQIFADERFAESARRLLTNIFNAGLFESAYLDPEETKAEVGNPDYMEAGYNAQLKSVVLLKNKDNIISKADEKAEKKTVYVPDYTTVSLNWFTGETTETTAPTVSVEILEKYYNVTDKPEEADFAIVGMSSPNGGVGYSEDDLAAGGNGYLPITLQYREYTAENARETAIANDPGKEFLNSETGEINYTDNAENRSYKGKSVTASNEDMLDMLEETKEAMGDKPVIVYMRESKPMVWSEVEPLADAIVVGFGVSDQAAVDIIAGQVEPSGLLPMQQPIDMDTVEAQNEDVGQDMECYVDSEGNTYDFAYGLNWSGVIDDERVAAYGAKAE